MHEAAETSLWFRFAVAALATWRLTHLVVLEDGPFGVMARLRRALGRAGRVLDCFYCSSIWTSAPLALFVSRRLVVWLIVWPALSGVACIVHRATEPPLVAPPAADGSGLDSADRGER